MEVRVGSWQRGSEDPSRCRSNCHEWAGLRTPAMHGFNPQPLAAHLRHFAIRTRHFSALATLTGSDFLSGLASWPK